MPRLSIDDAIDDLCVEETQSATRVGDQTTDQGSSQQSSMGTNKINTSAANRLIGEVVQSRRRPLLGPNPG